MPLTRIPKTNTINANILNDLDTIMKSGKDGDLGSFRLTKNGKYKSGESSTSRFGQWVLKVYDRARGKYVSDAHFKSQNYATRRQQFRLQDYINKVRTTEAKKCKMINGDLYKAGDYSSLVKKYHHRHEKSIGPGTTTHVQFGDLKEAIVAKDAETKGVFTGIEKKRNPEDSESTKAVRKMIEQCESGKVSPYQEKGGDGVNITVFHFDDMDKNDILLSPDTRYTRCSKPDPEKNSLGKLAGLRRGDIIVAAGSKDILIDKEHHDVLSRMKPETRGQESNIIWFFRSEKNKDTLKKTGVLIKVDLSESGNYCQAPWGVKLETTTETARLLNKYDRVKYEAYPRKQKPALRQPSSG